MNDKTISIKEQNVSNLHILLISSFFQLSIDQCENCDVGCLSGINDYNLSLFECEKELDSPCSLTLVGSKAIHLMKILRSPNGSCY